MEAVEIPKGIIRGQLDPQLYSTHLTPLEQKLLLGGSVFREGTKGELMSVEEIFESDESLHIRPTAGLPAEQITNERRGTFIEGYFPILHFAGMSYRHRVFLPEVINGRIEPIFRIQLILVTGKVAKERDIPEVLINEFPPDYQRYFKLRIGKAPRELFLERITTV